MQHTYCDEVILNAVWIAVDADMNSAVVITDASPMFIIVVTSAQGPGALHSSGGLLTSHGNEASVRVHLDLSLGWQYMGGVVGLCTGSIAATPWDLEPAALTFQKLHGVVGVLPPSVYRQIAIYLGSRQYLQPWKFRGVICDRCNLHNRPSILGLRQL